MVEHGEQNRHTSTCCMTVRALCHSIRQHARSDNDISFLGENVVEGDFLRVEFSVALRGIDESVKNHAAKEESAASRVTCFVRERFLRSQVPDTRRAPKL